MINSDIEDEVSITVIATGFEEKKEKVELPKVKNWSPTREPSALKASEKVLSKSLIKDRAVKPLPAEIIDYENSLDIPTFLRKVSPNA